ncbi:hypothetical protein F4781DRAFT_428377 [Annulohypoxylon bovei var. microspora]|nr:hypothetical protein F4781DRAFT_428377 [Annulohypoxylon bovei var. microspora]
MPALAGGSEGLTGGGALDVRCWLAGCGALGPEAPPFVRPRAAARPQAEIRDRWMYLSIQAHAQNPYFESGYNGEGYVWDGLGGSGGSGSNGGDSSGYGSASGSDNSGLEVFADFDVGQAMKYGTAHGIIAALCFAILFPAGAILMRIIPGRHAWWIHALFQVVAYILYIAAAALGIRLVQMIKIPPSGSSLLESSSTNAHPIIGLVILAVLFFQPPLGFIHHSKFKRLGRRTAWSHAHLWIGRLTLTLGVINGGLGLQLARASESVIIAYAVVAGIIWLIWVLVAVVGESRRRRKASPRRGQPRVPETRAYVADLPPPGARVRLAQPTPTTARTGRRHRDDERHRYNHNGNTDEYEHGYEYGHNRHGGADAHDPSPPYSPSPFRRGGGPPGYAGGGAQATEMRPVKGGARDSGSASSFSSRGPQDGDRRY